MYAKYAAVLGGSGNRAYGRFSVVVGSSLSLVNGRKSVAVGYNATVRGDHSAGFSFNGVGCDIDMEAENTIRMCADDITYNGVSLTDTLDSFIARRDLEETDDETTKLDELEAFVEAKEAELEAFETKMEILLTQRAQLIARNNMLLLAKSK